MAFEGGIRRTKQLVPSFAFNFNHKLAPGLSLAGSCPKLEFIIFLFSVFLALQLSATILSLLVFYLHELIPFWLDCCKIHFLSHKLSHSLTHNTRNTHTHTQHTKHAKHTHTHATHTHADKHGRSYPCVCVVWSNSPFSWKTSCFSFRSVFFYLTRLRSMLASRHKSFSTKARLISTKKDFSGVCSDELIGNRAGKQRIAGIPELARSQVIFKAEFSL